MRYLWVFLFFFACVQPEDSNETGTDSDNVVVEDTGETNPDTDDTDDTEETDTDDTLSSDGTHNIDPSGGSGGTWGPGQVGTTDLGARIQIPANYDPKTLASPVIWLFNERLEDWQHTASSSAIVVDLNEYNDTDAIFAKLQETVSLLEEKYNVDKGRFYFAGWSAGGNLAVIIGSLNQDIIAGIMVFPGTGGGVAQPYMRDHTGHKVRLFYACGDQDPNYPWSQVKQEAEFWQTAYGYTTRFERVNGAPHFLDEGQTGIRADAWDWMHTFNMAN